MLRKVPLRRKTPLKNRKLWRPKPRADEDKVSPEDYEYIMARDGDCIFRGLPDHVCRGRKTIEHGPRRNENAYGVRAKSTRDRMVVACWDANVNGYASAHRDFSRDHLAKVEPR